MEEIQLIAVTLQWGNVGKLQENGDAVTTSGKENASLFKLIIQFVVKTNVKIIESNMKKKTVFIVLLAFISVVISYYIIKKYFFPETLKSVGMSVLSSIENQSPSNIIKYMMADEKKNLNVNEETLSNFFSMIYTPHLKGFKKVEIKEWAFPEQQSLAILIPMKDDGGRESGLVISTIVTEDGIKLLGLIQKLYSAVIAANWDSDKPQTDSDELKRHWVKVTQKLLPDLERTGIKGVSMGMGENTEYFTWQEIITRMSKD